MNKKETQIHATVEVIEIMPNFSFTGGTIEEIKEQAKQGLKARFEGLGFDNINITNVQVFEHEEKRISTEDLIAAARHCANELGCDKCIFYYDVDNCTNTMRFALANRLEELHNQQKAIPKNDSKSVVEPQKDCENCGYSVYEVLEEPCCSCRKESNWIPSDIPHICDYCKYENHEPYLYPCAECDEETNSLWEYKWS